MTTSDHRKKVCVVLVDRANYGRMWPVMKEIQQHPELQLQTICAGTMLLERFGKAEQVVIQDGFNVDARVYLEVEGSVPATMAKSIGLAIMEFTNEYLRLSPDILLLIGDRFEALGAAIAAAYMNIPIAHIQGGEVSGSIDECARHAISKFAQLHFPSTLRSAEYLVRMGERPEDVHCFGCPSGDYIRQLDTNLPDDFFTNRGVGCTVNPKEPFLLVIYHPTTTQYGTERAKVEELLEALDMLKITTVWLWPNIDAGSNDVSKAIRVYREHHEDSWLYLVKNLDPVSFQKCLKMTACAVGNSSSFIRDSTFSGTPVVLTGDRQFGREYGENLINVEMEKEKIRSAVLSQLKHGRFHPSSLYGNGNAAQRIVQKIGDFKPYLQKKLNYIFET